MTKTVGAIVNEGEAGDECGSVDLSVDSSVDLGVDSSVDLDVDLNVDLDLGRIGVDLRRVMCGWLWRVVEGCGWL